MLDELLKDPRSLGVVGVLALIVVAFVREWIVPGVTHIRIIAGKDQEIADLKTERVQLRSEKDEYKQKVWIALNITDRTQQLRGGVIFGDKGA
jgi:hypothetical protein